MDRTYVQWCASFASTCHRPGVKLSAGERGLHTGNASAVVCKFCQSGEQIQHLWRHTATVSAEPNANLHKLRLRPAERHKTACL